MTVHPAPRPLLPVLARMALGLGLAGLGGVLTWQGAEVRPTPGMGTTTTPVRVALDGPRPSDLAAAATLQISGDRSSVSVDSLAAGSALLVGGHVTHRERNPVELRSDRVGRQVKVTLALTVQPTDRPGMIVSGPEPVQHVIALQLSRAVPVTLSARTVSGDQTLDLSALTVRGLNLRTVSGDQTVTLPARTAGPAALVSTSGNIRVTAARGAVPEALRVNSVGGDQVLNLAGARVGTLGLGTASGDIDLTLPAEVPRAAVTTASGDVTVTARPGTRGNLDVRTQGGDVTLRVPAGLRLRVRFTDRDTVSLPRGLPPATAPDLDVFVDAPSGNFTLDSTP